MNFKKWTNCSHACLSRFVLHTRRSAQLRAAIDACTGADVQLAHINSDSKEINIYVHKGANLAKQQLPFTLPDGATIKADEHSPNDILNNYDFSNEFHSRTFTVTSEDGEWTATYTVKVVPAEMPETFHFEEPASLCRYRIRHFLRIRTRNFNQCFARSAMVQRQPRLQTYRHDRQPHRLSYAAGY